MIEIIYSPLIPLHTFTIDFILVIHYTKNEFNYLLLVINKFSKMIAIFPS